MRRGAFEGLNSDVVKVYNVKRKPPVYRDHETGSLGQGVRASSQREQTVASCFQRLMLISYERVRSVEI